MDNSETPVALFVFCLLTQGGAEHLLLRQGHGLRRTKRGLHVDLLGRTGWSCAGHIHRRGRDRRCGAAPPSLGNDRHRAALTDEPRGVAAEVSELGVHSVEVGASASITFGAFLDQTLDASVLSAGRVPLVTKDEVTYRVRLRLDPASTAGLDLRSGLRATVRFP